MKISKPEIEVVRFANEDVIATSLYYMSSADYNAAKGTSYTDPYVIFNGSMTPAGDGVWKVPDPYAVTAVEDLGLITGIPEIGFPGKGDISYEAYYKDGDFYTNGVTYKESIGQ